MSAKTAVVVALVAAAVATGVVVAMALVSTTLVA